MNKTWMRLAGAGLAAAMSVSLFAACAPKEEGDRNENDVLEISSGEFDKVFNPFFATSLYDSNIVGQTQISMLSADKDGKEVTYGPDQPVVTLDYNETMYTATGAATTNGDTAATTVYQFVIKNGIKFSDGVELTAHDVLFNLYMYLDPNYTGSNTMYSTDIVGLRAYTTQDPGATEASEEAFNETYASLARMRANAVLEYTTNPDNTTAWQNRVKTYNDQRRQMFIAYDDENAEENGGKIADKFVEYNEEGIRADIELIKEEFRNELETTYNGIDMTAYKGQLNEDTGKYENGYDLDEDKVWQGFFLEMGLISRVLDPSVVSGTVYETDEEGRYVIDWQGADRNADYTREDAIEYAYDALCGSDRKIAEILTMYSTGTTILTTFAGDAKEAYYGAIQEVAGGLAVKSISGIRILDASEFSGSTQYPEGEYDMLQITINGIDPKAKWNFAFSVAPMHYYSTPELVKAAMSDTTYSSNFGVEFSSVSFMNEVKSRNAVPVGAGVYQASTMNDETLLWETDANGNQTQASVNSFNTLRDGFENSNIVYFIRNENFVTTGGNEEAVYNAKIKHVQYKVLPTTQVMTALQGGSVTLADPSATRENIDAVETSSHLAHIDVQSSGYGYIGINAKFIPSIYVRRALMTVFDPTLVQNYYPGTLSKPVYRNFSLVSWVYEAFPDDGLEAWSPEPYYDYDDTFASAHAWLNLDRDCQFVNGVWMYKNEPIEITLTVAGETYDHPAYATFLKASEILNAKGIKTTVVNDARALYKLASGGLAVWAAAWTSTVDPDMYQVYHKDSRATSVLNWGYDYLITEDKATAEEKRIINDLADLIDAGRETINQAERAEIYREATDLVMDLAVEFPLYQRSDMYVYNKNVIDASTFYPDPTPYMSPIAEIWKVSFILD